MAEEMENEFMKRGYLLPDGCKDLSDALKSKAQPAPGPARPGSSAPLPPITGEMTVPPLMTVRELAAALSQKPFQIIIDLMEIDVFATVSHPLDFDVITRVLRNYGLATKRAA